MSIIDQWLERADEKYGSREKGIAKLNQICNMKLRSSEISAYKSGKRKPKSCVFALMMIDVLLTELEKAGWKNASLDMSNKQYMDLIEALTLPRSEK